jgi:hypothetical protein
MSSCEYEGPHELRPIESGLLHWLHDQYADGVSLVELSETYELDPQYLRYVLTGAWL